MSEDEHNWRANTPDKELSYNMWEYYHYLIIGLITLFSVFLTK
jgi:hypothetical protein